MYFTEREFATDNEFGTDIECSVSIIEDTNDNVNGFSCYYDEGKQRCSLFVRMITTEGKDKFIMLHIELNNFTNDVTLDYLVALIKKEDALFFDVTEWLFAYKINIETRNNNKPLYKIFDNNCFVIKDLIVNNNGNNTNIYLLRNTNSKSIIKQNSGILLNPNKNVSSSTLSISPSNNSSWNSKQESTPTFNTINKIIAPNITVLVVEDNPINCKILSKILKKHKINYKLAKNGLEAIKMYSLRRN